MPVFEDAVRAILAGAPNLVKTPGLTVGLAQGIIAPQSGPVEGVSVGQSANVAASQQGVILEQQEQADVAKARAILNAKLNGSGEGGLGGLINRASNDVTSHLTDAANDVGLGASNWEAAANVMNKPLQTVQHIYRAYHDLITRDGVIGGGKQVWMNLFDIPDELLNPNQKGAQDTQFGRSWNATANGSKYRDVDGNAVNIGFDLEHFTDYLSGQKFMPAGWTRNSQGVMEPTASGGIDYESGLINGVFDIGTDPLSRLGDLTKATRAAGIVFGGDKIALAEDEATRAGQLDKLAKGNRPYVTAADGKTVYVGGRVLVGPRAVTTVTDPDGNLAYNVPQLAANNPGIHDAFTKLAGMNTKEILNAYPALNDRNMIHDLGRASTVDEVSKVFERGVTRYNYSFVHDGLPATSLTRRIIGANKSGAETLSDAFESNPVTRATSKYPGQFIDSTTLRKTNDFDLDDPSLPNALRDSLAEFHTTRVANSIVADYIDAPDDATRKAVLVNSYLDAIRSAGVQKGLDDAQIRTLPVFQRYAADINDEFGRQFQSSYGYDRNGNSIGFTDPASGNRLSVGLLENQHGRVTLLNRDEVMRQIDRFKTDPANQYAGPQLGSMFANADEWVYRHAMTPIKTLELTTGGFGARVGTAEFIPAALANGGTNLVRAGLASGIEKVTGKMLAKEGDALIDTPVQTPDGIFGRIARVNGEKMWVKTKSGVEVHDADALDFMHKPVTDDEVLAAADRFNMPVEDKRALPHIRAAMGHALYGVGKALTDADTRDQAAFNQLTFDTHTVPESMDADSHHAPFTTGGPAEDARTVMRALHVKPGKLSADQFTDYTGGSNEFPMFQHFALNEASGGEGFRIGAKAYLGAIRNGASENEARRAFVEADFGWMHDAETPEAQKFNARMAIGGQSGRQGAELRSQLLEGLTYGQNGKLQHDLLESIAGEREVPSIMDLAKKKIEDRPIRVKGRVIEPDAAPERLVERATALGWRKMINPTINTISRAPIFTHLSTEEYKFLKPLVESGKMSEVEARTLAQLRATQRMLPMIHNVALRSQAARNFRNAIPFYFAQEQSYRRYGRAIFQDPLAFRKAMLAHHAVQSSGLLQQDQDGNKTIVYPGGGVWAHLATAGLSTVGVNVLNGIPSMMSGSLISLKNVAPEGSAPQVSQLVAVPLKAIQERFPASEPFISPVIGGAAEDQSLVDEMIPSATLKRIFQATPVLDREAAFGDLYNNNLAYAQFKSENLRRQARKAQNAGNATLAKKLRTQADQVLPGPLALASVRQAAMDRIKNATRIQMLTKAAVGFFSPLSPDMATGIDVKYKPIFQTYVDKYGLERGQQMFLDKYPNATAATVFQSDNSATNVSLPATGTALSWLDANRTWATKHPELAAYLIPQKPGNYDAEAYNQELAMGLRQKKGPDQMVSALYAAATDPSYYQSLDIFEKAYNADSKNPGALEQLDKQWDQYTTGLGNANPAWFEEHNDPQKISTARQVLLGLTKAIADPSTPDSPQTEIAKGLIESWNAYQSAQQLVAQGDSTYTKSGLQDQFNTYLDQEVQKNPMSSPLVTGVFRQLVNANG